MTDTSTHARGLHAPSGSALPSTDAPRTPDAPPAWVDLLDLASELVGGEAIATNDDFFAEVGNLVRSATPTFLPDEYTDRGKWMDGWESRRRRTPGSDWAIVRLGLRGVLSGVDIDTAYFTGNHPPRATVELCDVPADAGADALAAATWRVVLDDVHLDGGSHNWYAIADDAPASHVRLTIHPDGGVARLRAYGVVTPDFDALCADDGRFDLAAAASGGRSVACNDMYFSHRNNLLLPNPPRTMGEGWETRRRREPGNDWIIVRLGCAGVVDEAIVETTHFKGNFPDRCSLEALPPGTVDPAEDDTRDWADPTLPWVRLLGEQPLTAHAAHPFARELEAVGPVSHVRLSIYPDGGVARLRLLGRRAT